MILECELPGQVKRGSIPWIDQSPVGESPNLPGEPARWENIIVSMSVIGMKSTLTRFLVSGFLRRRRDVCPAAQAPLKRLPKETLSPTQPQQLQAKLRSVQSQAQINGELISVQWGPASTQIQSSSARAQFQLQLAATKFQLKARHHQLLSLNRNQGSSQMQKVCNLLCSHLIDYRSNHRLLQPLPIHFSDAVMGLKDFSSTSSQNILLCCLRLCLLMLALHHQPFESL